MGVLPLLSAEEDFTIYLLILTNPLQQQKSRLGRGKDPSHFFSLPLPGVSWEDPPPFFSIPVLSTYVHLGKMRFRLRVRWKQPLKKQLVLSLHVQRYGGLSPALSCFCVAAGGQENQPLWGLWVKEPSDVALKVTVPCGALYASVLSGAQRGTVWHLVKRGLGYRGKASQNKIQLRSV